MQELQILVSGAIVLVLFSYLYVSSYNHQRKEQSNKTRVIQWLKSDIRLPEK